MPDIDPVAQVLERHRPFPLGVEDDWRAVVAAARRRRLRPAVALGLGVAAAAALALFWPFGAGERTGILERALAAAGHGPVVHVVLREGWGGALVDLATGARKRLFGEREIWYDPARGLHEVSRLGGADEGDILYAPGRIAQLQQRELRGLAVDYRTALRTGRAKVIGRGEVEGAPVYWVRVQAKRIVVDYRLRELAQDVAVSRRTFLPVGLRETLGRKLSPDGVSRVLAYETLPAGSGDFSAHPQPGEKGGLAFRFGPAGRLGLAQARRILPGLWAGRRLATLPLAGIAKLAWAERTVGHGDWRNETDGLRFAYGSTDAGVSALPGTAVSPERPYVQIDEFPSGVVQAPGFGGYAPPAGSVFVVGTRGTVEANGVTVAISATSPELVIAAARALEPLPAG